MFGSPSNNLILLLLLFSGTAVYGMTPSLPYERPGNRQLDAPPLVPDKVVPPQIRLPAPPLDKGDVGSDFFIVLRKIVLEGNTIFTNEELLSVVSAYLNKQIGSDELQNIRIALSQYYIDHGYITSGVILPDQKVKDGVVKFRVIEGELSIIQLSGQDRLHHSYIYGRIVRGVSKPLNVKDLQNQLFLLQQDQRIERINAQLQPGAVRGESVLYVAVQEAEQVLAYFTANNHRPPGVGAERGIFELVHLNLTGSADTLNFRYGATEGADDVYVSYDYPLNSRATKLLFFYEKTDSEVIEEPFASLDVGSRSSTSGIGISFPVYSRPNEQLDLGLILEKRKSETFLFGLPFSFEAGPQDGVSRITVLRFYQSWYKRYAKNVLALRSTLNMGFDVDDATVNDGNIPDTKFQSWLGQFQWLHRFNNNQQILTRVTTQFTDDPLLPLEQFAAGGANSVRGYRENQLVGDNGTFASFEYRFPLLKPSHDGYLQFVTFVDYGRISNKDRNTPRPNEIYSVGAGIRWAHKAGVELEVFRGEALRDVNNPNNDLQDDGWHVQFRMKLF